MQIFGPQSDGRGQSPEWRWQLTGQGGWNKEWNIPGEFQPCQEVTSLMCAQKKVENLAWDIWERFQSRGSMELCLISELELFPCLETWVSGHPSTWRVPHWFFSVKKLRVLREEKKNWGVWGVWRGFTKRRKNAGREMEGKLIWLPRVFYAGYKVLGVWMNWELLTHIGQEERGGRWEVQEGRSAWSWQTDEGCVCSEWDSKMKPQGPSMSKQLLGHLGPEQHHVVLGMRA